MHFFKLPLDLFIKKLKSPVIYLTAVWVIGLLVGMFFAFTVRTLVSSLIHTIVCCRASITGLISVLILPLVISAMAISVPLFLYPICFFKAFSYGFCLYSVTFVFGDAGWLFATLLLFSDSVMIVLLNWLWCRHIVVNKNTSGQDFARCTIAATLIALMDYFLISPYLIDLLHYY